MFKKLQFLFFLVLLQTGLMAQYSLTAKVTDKENGKVLAGANVMINNTFRSTITNTKGEFTFNKLFEGEYDLRVSFLGFKTYEEKINLNSDKSIQIKLEPMVYMSDEIIISASRENPALSNTKTTLDAEQINRSNNGQDLPYLLRMTPSLVLTSDAGAGIGYTGMRIRGSDLSRINVTLNGVPVNDAESQGVFFVDLPDLASSIDNMQIQRGVGTSTNGAAAFGASINIKTDEFSADPYAELNSAAGSYNTLKSSLKFGSGLINGKWNFNGRVSTIASDGYIDRASSDLKSAYLSTAYYGEKDIFKAIAILGKEKTYQSWYGIPKDSLETNRTYNPAGEMYDNNGKFIGYYDNQTDNYWQNYYQLHYAHQFSKSLNFTAAGFYTRGYGYYESYRNDEDFADYGLNDTIIGGDTISSSDMITRKWLDNHYYGFNLSLIYNNNPLKITAGGGWNQYDGDHYGNVIWSQIARYKEFDRNWYLNNGKKTEANVFAKAEYSFNENLTAFADLQFRTINYKIEGTHDDLRVLDQDHNFNFINPKLGLFYKLNSKNNLFTSIAISNREPNRSVYRDADDNQNINSEELNDFELGYVFNSNKFSFSANAFYMLYKDQLVMTGKINNVGAAIMQNVDNSYRAGIEVEAGWMISNKIRWNVNATYSQNKIKDFTTYVDDWDNWGSQIEETYASTDISYSPSIIANSDISFEPLNNMIISLMSNYVGKQYIDNTTNDERSLDAYFINNININYSIETNFIKRIEFLVSLNNIFGEKYVSNAWVYRYSAGGELNNMAGYYPQAEFNFMAGINLKF